MYNYDKRERSILLWGLILGLILLLPSIIMRLQALGEIKQIEQEIYDKNDFQKSELQ